MGVKDEWMQIYIDKLVAMGYKFQNLYKEKKYPQAKYLYDTAHRVAIFLGFPEEEMYKLFGNGYDGSDEVKYDELFRKDFLEDIDWKCCIIQHKTYQDIACRRTGEPVRYYSDEDFCAMCRQQKRAT